MKFDRKNRKSGQENKFYPNQSFIGTSIFLKGELTGEEDLVIEGKFQGKIDLRNHNLIVEQGGKAKADIHVKNITINGEVNGNIHASGKVLISKEGQMKGDIIAPRISIDDGAQFKGSVKMNREEDKPSLPKAKPPSLPAEKKKQEDDAPSPQAEETSK